MKKALVIISLVAALALLTIPLMGAGSCSSGPTITDNDITTFRGLLTRMDDAEGAIGDLKGEVEDINGKTAPDLSDYVTLVKYNELLDKYNGLLDESNSASLVSRIKALEAKVGSSNTPPPINTTGKVSVEITDAWGCDFEEGENSLYGIYSGETAASYRFTVSVTNNIDESRWIYISLDLFKDSGSGAGNVAVASTKLTNLTYGSLAYSTVTSPNTDGTGATRISFSPSSSATRFSVGKGKTVDVDFLLEIKMAAGGGYTEWDGNLAYSVKTQP